MGSNLGDRLKYLQKATDLIFERIGQICRISRVYKSSAMGFAGDDFLNAVVHCKTILTADQVMPSLLLIEKELGRQRPFQDDENKTSKTYRSRTIDLDFLAFEDLMLEVESLTLPHPRMQQRLFVLQPFLEVAPDWVHPRLNLNLSNLKSQCPDSVIPEAIHQVLVNPADAFDFNSIGYMAIEGNIGAGKTSLAQMIARDFKGKLILERFAQNPFLPEFYKNPKRYALSLEMSFLADRFQQLAEQNAQYDLFNDLIITDYDRYKSLIFAKITLTDHEFDLYQKFFHLMHRELPRPKVYVYLVQSTKRLLDNIMHRGRSYEQSIDAGYLQKIHAGYMAHLESEMHQGPVIRIDLNDLDFMNRRNDYLNILRQIKAHSV